MFQVESRPDGDAAPAEAAVFYDLVVEVALIRPGPIQGGSVHPIHQASQGLEPVVYDHPSMEPALRTTLGVPLFQGGRCSSPVGLCGFTGGGGPAAPGHGFQTFHREDAAAGDRFYAGMAQRARDHQRVADRIYEAGGLRQFLASESHSRASPRWCTYSSWFKLSSPGGVLRGPAAGPADGLLLTTVAGGRCAQARVTDARAGRQRQWRTPRARTADSDFAVGIGRGAPHRRRPHQRIVDERNTNGPYASLLDLTGRVVLSVPQTEALATAGALGCFDITRREAPGRRGGGQRPRPAARVGSSSHVPTLPGMTEVELAAADVGGPPASHRTATRTQFLRDDLDAMGVVPPVGCSTCRTAASADRRGGDPPAAPGHRTGRDVHEHRGRDRHGQRALHAGVWARHRKLAQTASALLIRGQVQNATGAVTVVAERMGRISMKVGSRSRDFR